MAVVRYRETGNNRDRPRPGQPRVSTPRDDTYICQLAWRRRHVTARTLPDEWLPAIRFRVSIQTVRNRYIGMNLTVTRFNAYTFQAVSIIRKNTIILELTLRHISNIPHNTSRLNAVRLRGCVAKEKPLTNVRIRMIRMRWTNTVQARTVANNWRRVVFPYEFRVTLGPDHEKTLR